MLLLEGEEEKIKKNQSSWHLSCKKSFMDSHLTLLFHAHNFHPNAGPPAAFKASAANTSLLPKPCRALPSTARRASRARRSTAANMRSSTSENRCNRRHQWDWAFGSTHCWLLLYLWDLHGSTFDFAWITFTPAKCVTVNCTIDTA